MWTRIGPSCLTFNPAVPSAEEAEAADPVVHGGDDDVLLGGQRLTVIDPEGAGAREVAASKDPHLESTHGDITYQSQCGKLWCVSMEISDINHSVASYGVCPW